MRVTSGVAFLVAVDMRQSSSTFLKWFGIEVTESSGLQIWAPAEFARGICSLTNDCVVQYKCTGLFDAKGDSTVRWDDPDIGVKWPIKYPIMSDRDLAAPTVKKFFRNMV